MSGGIVDQLLVVHLELQRHLVGRRELGGRTGGAPATMTGTPEGCGCRVAGEPTPPERSLFTAVAAMALVVGLRRQLRREGEL